MISLTETFGENVKVCVYPMYINYICTWFITSYAMLNLYDNLTFIF